MASTTATVEANDSTAPVAAEIVAREQALKINVADAVGGKTIVGQLAVSGVTTPGFVTAYGCADGLPRDAAGAVSKADLNFDGTVSAVASNRLIVKADAIGDVCFYTSAPAEMIVDVNGVTDTGVTPIANTRTDTRSTTGAVAAGSFLKVNVADAVGGKTVFGQLAVAGVTESGFVTAYGCADGLPTDGAGTVSKADLNFDGTVSRVASNRLIVKADIAGDVCFYTLRAANMIVDINGVTSTGVTPIPNQRLDTRFGAGSVTTITNRYPEAAGGKVVFGQLAVARATGRGFVTAYGCADGLPRDAAGNITKADLNFDGGVTGVASNRLIVKADANGDVCFYASEPVALIIDVNGYTESGITAIPNQRTDTRGNPNPNTVTPGGGTGTTTTTTTTTTTVPTSPPAAGIQAVYVLPADKTSTAGRAAAIASTVSAVQTWFDGQTGGRHPVFQRDGTAIDVITVTINESAAQATALPDFEAVVEPQVRAALPTAKKMLPLTLVFEGQTSDGACGRYSTIVVMAVENCSIFPSADAFPFGMTYLLAHELAHLLGAVDSCAPNAIPGGHVGDNNKDLLYEGPLQRDFMNIVLDPGNDDYFRHSNAGCTDIDDNPLLATD